MKSPKLPSVTSPNAPQAPVNPGGRNLSAMYTTPLHSMFAPLASGMMDRRAGRKSLIGS